MNLAIKISEQTITAWDIIPRLQRYQMLPQLIQESIIDEAITSIECTPEETALACQQFDQQHQLTTEAIRQAWIERHGVEQEELQEIATRRLKIEKFKRQQWEHTLNAYFRQRKTQLDKVIFSIIRVSEMSLAQEIYFRIQEGQSFAELAKEFSQGQEAETGGIVSPIELGNLPPAFAQLFISHHPGELLPPFPMGDSVVVMRIENLSYAKLDAPTRQRLLDELFQNWLRSQLQQQGYQINNLSIS